MPFDPDWPSYKAQNSSAKMREQLTSLKSLIDGAYSAINAVPAGPPGPQGEKGDPGDAGPEGRHVVNVSDNGSGQAIIEMSDGDTYGPFTVASGPQGDQGSQGEQGPPGEVSAQQLSDAIAGTASNVNAVELMNLTVSDPPTQSEMQTIASKLDELINALKRW